jgi:hypothetical protein
MTDVNIPEPAPVRNERPAVWDAVIQAMKDRNDWGISKYGTPLQPFNGRDALRDAAQESMDLTVYLFQAILENEERKKEIDGIFCRLLSLTPGGPEFISIQDCISWIENQPRDSATVTALRQELKVARASASAPWKPATVLPPEDRDMPGQSVKVQVVDSGDVWSPCRLHLVTGRWYGPRGELLNPVKWREVGE